MGASDAIKTKNLSNGKDIFPQSEKNTEYSAKTLQETITKGTLIRSRAYGDCYFIEFAGDSCIVLQSIFEDEQRFFKIPDDFINGNLCIISEEEVERRLKRFHQELCLRWIISWHRLVSQKGNIVHKEHGAGTILSEIDNYSFLVGFEKEDRPIVCQYTDFADGILRSEHELQIRGQMLPTGFFDDLKVFYEKHAKLSLAELEAKRNLIDEASKNDDSAAASQ